MRRYSKIFLLLVVLLVGCNGVCMAQSDEEKLSGKKFRVTLINDWHGPQLFIKTGKTKYDKLDLYRMAYTQPYRYQAEQAIVLYVEKVSTEGEVVYAPLIKFAASGQIMEPLLALYWNAKLKKVGGKLIEFSSKVFPYGSYQVANMSDSPIIGYVGGAKKKQYCKANKECIIRPGLKNGERTPIVFYAKIEGETETAFSSMTIHREQKRVILFLTQGRNSLERKMFFAQSLVDFKKQPEVGP